jgi:hypothetical protein
VKVLGYDGKVVFNQAEDGLLVRLPDQKVVEYLPCIKVELA